MMVITVFHGAFFFKHTVLLKTTPPQANIYSFNYLMGFLSLQKNRSTACVLLSQIVVKVLVVCSLRAVVLPLRPSSSLQMPRTWTKRAVTGCSTGVSRRRRSEEGPSGVPYTTLVAGNVPDVCPASDLNAVGFYFKDVRSVRRRLGWRRICGTILPNSTYRTLNIGCS